MIGVFDSGLGGLTVLRALVDRFPDKPFLYLGDHANLPYGNRPSAEVIDLTRASVEALFSQGCKLVLLGCNTATAVAARHLQQTWLPSSQWRGHNVLGIVAPTVEAATQTPWAVSSPQYPQKYNTDLIAVFGTTRTINSDAYPEEIRKRCPRVTVVQQICSQLAGAIEDEAPEAELERLVEEGVRGVNAQTNGMPPHRAILGCTHFPLVEHLFRRHLPPFTRILSQPEVVADSLEDYLARHPHYIAGDRGHSVTLLTTGDPAEISARARVFWPEVSSFELLAA
ncbi:glutamate racemase [Hyphomicrobium sp. xq]|uniref:Glutamate racemase n=1 Tax=Hyphomicrobium album TaxID=2665159 RepID=A0A6I3KLI0_9HYPH|nr:aspartate/glutamate racemase family protein [Hyphomicrobium album]MTD94587.1 glutamate racemase [Hyphomicrobium album]